MKKSILILLLGWINFSVMDAQHLMKISDGSTLNFNQMDSLSVYKEVRQYLIKQVNKGYLYASLDSISLDSGLHVWHVCLGEKYTWDRMILKVDSNQYIFESFNPEQLSERFGSDGYPFASFRLESIAEKEGKVEVTYLLDKGPEIVFDSVSVIGDNPYRPASFYQILGFQPGEVFDHQIYGRIPNSIARFPAVRLVNPIDIGFGGGKAIVFLEMKSIKSNQFDGIVGIVPGSESSIQVIGDVKLRLNSVFKTAASTSLDWKSFGNASQALDLTSELPFVLRTKIGWNSKFSILKQDSSFLNVRFNNEINIPVGYQHTVSAGYDYQSNTTLVQGENNYQAFHYNWYGLGVKKNPLSLNTGQNAGHFYEINFFLGDRRFSEDTLISNRSNLTMYIKGHFQINKKVNRSGLLVWKHEGAFLHNKSLLIPNEQLRLGGLQSIRGFVENQFFASQYYFTNLEYRLYFEENSFVRLITDHGMIENVLSTKNLLSSVGIGLSIDTQSGVFNFIFASGWQYGFSNTSINNNLVHIGYSSTF